jgi:hypothetical protein
MIEQQRYEEAKRRVKQLSVFYQHLVVYILVNAGLAVINLTSNPDEIWFTYPLLGWGIGIAAHGLTVFLGEGWAKSWEERKIRKLMEKESRSQG